MTADELRDCLQGMKAEERLAFMKRAGFPPDWDDGRVMECFVKEAAWERAICHALSAPTEVDKAGQATIEAAHYARLGYIIGIVAIGLSVVSLIVSIIALAK